MASIDSYLRSEPRYKLSQITNSDINNPDPVDAGNWTGCNRNSGNLVGTHRDWSACAETAYLGRPATYQDMSRIDYEALKKRIREVFWDKAGLDDLSQDVANIYMHIFLHFGNVWVVQDALNKMGENLKVDGIAGRNSDTLKALIKRDRENSIRLYNRIRDSLEIAYLNSNPKYVRGFINGLNTYFPKKQEIGGSLPTSGQVTSVFIPVAITMYLFYRFFIKK